jgi:nitroreductase
MEFAHINDTQENTMIKDLIVKNRSYRRFDQEVAIERETLRELVDLARLSASAANLQPLRYILSCDQKECTDISTTSLGSLPQGLARPG